MPRRQGFTLIELLVSMALIVFIMVILSEAFVAGLDAFRQLKATGDMDAQMRTVSSILRRDLRACRLGDSVNDFRRVSEVELPPRKGFFRLDMGKAGVTTEGSDADSLACGRSPASGPSFKSNGGTTLHFTVNLSQNDDTTLEHHMYRRENYLSVQTTNPLLVGNGPVAFQDGKTYNSPWGEVVYFLQSTPATTTGTGPTQLYALYRRQLVVVAEESVRNALNTSGPNRVPVSAQAQYYGISCKADQAPNAGYLYFPGPEDLTIPQRRFAMNSTAGTKGLPFKSLPAEPSNPNKFLSTYPRMGPPDGPEAATLQGADLLLTDVVSFTGQLIKPGDTGYDFPTTGVYDTWSQMLKVSGGNPYDYSTWSSTIPYFQKVIGIHITVRVWDRRTQATRQINLDQDL